MYAAQQVSGPQAQYTGQQVAGPMGPMQVAGPSAYYPLQTDQWTGMFSMMMPMIMLILMFAILMPLFKGITTSARE